MTMTSLQDTAIAQQCWAMREMAKRYDESAVEAFRNKEFFRAADFMTRAEAMLKCADRLARVAGGRE